MAENFKLGVTLIPQNLKRFKSELEGSFKDLNIGADTTGGAGRSGFVEGIGSLIGGIGEVTTGIIKSVATLGLIGVGINSVLEFLKKSSPVAEKSLGILEKSFFIALLPLSNAVGQVLLPISLFILEQAIKINEVLDDLLTSFDTKLETFLGIQVEEGTGADVIGGTALGAAIGGVIAGPVGAVVGGLLVGSKQLQEGIIDSSDILESTASSLDSTTADFLEVFDNLPEAIKDQFEQGSKTISNSFEFDLDEGVITNSLNQAFTNAGLTAEQEGIDTIQTTNESARQHIEEGLTPLDEFGTNINESTMNTINTSLSQAPSIGNQFSNSVLAFAKQILFGGENNENFGFRGLFADIQTKPIPSGDNINVTNNITINEAKGETVEDVIRKARRQDLFSIRRILGNG